MEIIFTGDLYLGKSLFTIDSDVLKILNRSDYLVSNFEAVLQSENMQKRIDKQSNLQFSESTFNYYKNSIKSQMIFSLGNNHIHDLGLEGLAATKQFLNSQNNVSIFGAGLLDELRKPFIVNIGNRRIAFLAVSTDEPEVMSILAKEDYEGVLDYNDCEIFNIIKETKKQVDYFVILPHWGKEYIDYPSVQLREKAKKWIDAGADLVIGHHPHVVQGKEQYRGKWIYYSLGNYIFPDFIPKNGIPKKWKKKNNQSVILEIDLSEGVSIKETGLYFDTNKNILSINEESIKEMNEKSRVLDIITYKKYYAYYEWNLYHILKADYSMSSRIIRIFMGIMRKLIWT